MHLVVPFRVHMLKTRSLAAASDKSVLLAAALFTHGASVSGNAAYLPLSVNAVHLRLSMLCNCFLYCCCSASVDAVHLLLVTVALMSERQQPATLFMIDHTNDF
jgi:hypothetical protein